MTTNDSDQARSLPVTVTTKRMVHGTQFKRICKALEHLYYLLLFSSVPTYQGRSDTWESWLAVGTDLAVRTPPSAVDSQDRYVDSVHSQPRDISIAVKGNPEGLERLGLALRAIESVRATIADPGGDPANAALADPAVRESMVIPLESALKTAKIDEDQSRQFVALAAQSVESLMIEDITGIVSVATVIETSTAESVR